MLTDYLDDQLEILGEVVKKSKRKKDEQVGKAESIQGCKFSMTPQAYIEHKANQKDSEDDFDTEEWERIDAVAEKVTKIWQAWILGQKARAIHRPKLG